MKNKWLSLIQMNNCQIFISCLLNCWQILSTICHWKIMCFSLNIQIIPRSCWIFKKTYFSYGDFRLVQTAKVNYELFQVVWIFTFRNDVYDELEHFLNRRPKFQQIKKIKIFCDGHKIKTFETAQDMNRIDYSKIDGGEKNFIRNSAVVFPTTN